LIKFTCLGLLCVLVCTSVAGATGLVRVQQSDGSVQDYPNATIRYTPEAKTLSITTADGKGTLRIDQAACSYIGELYRCLLTRLSLTQNGQTHPLDFESGTVYANTTPAKLQLPLSSQSIPAHGILMALRTKAGTFISLTGTVDSGLK
jgi:hypothetical protein